MEQTDDVYERIDNLVNIDLIGRAGTHLLYKEVKKAANGSLCLGAAKGLANVVNPGAVVIICTGNVVRPWGAPEMDGPIGTIVLARALSIAFNAKPIILVEDGARNVLSSTCRVMELNVATDMGQLMRIPGTVLVSGLPSEDEKTTQESVRLIEEVKPSAIISVECIGANSKGVCHGMGGGAMVPPDYRLAKMGYIIKEARFRKIFTIGIGDGGNEIGMGNIKDAVKKIVPFGEKCNCPCEAGIAAEETVDLLIVSSVSNWGAYGIAASLARLLGNPDIFHSPELERRAIERCVEAGAWDGGGMSKFAIDRIPIDIHVGLVNMLKILK